MGNTFRQVIDTLLTLTFCVIGVITMFNAQDDEQFIQGLIVLGIANIYIKVSDTFWSMKENQ